ncbi:hypothetical protein B0A55_06476 [Friedmanniomyces simplex]|uniref:medium-chain acyl-CoA ligase n=1 Tax=Friedmanniomyces simplex TaxID=329884 RepID=A0A4U0X897_9PEZI|nr:hypothetical protein B0A55_06476 [Friedmanniomyces simplex]
MAHYYDAQLKRPTTFNFARDVVDYWAINAPENGVAMHWIREDRRVERRLSFEYFSRQSHRLAILLRDHLGMRKGDRLLLIMPRLPEWWAIATATVRCGVVVCPATTLLVDKDIEYRCNRSGAAVFIGDSVSVAKVLKHFYRLKPGDLAWILAEQGWAKAAWAFFATWNCGAGLFIHDDRRPFSPKETLNVLHHYPITTLCAPPTAYRQLVLDEMRRHYVQRPPNALRHCTGAGEPLNPEVIRLWKETSGLEICDGYGQTETMLVCGNFEGSPIRPGSMGKPSPGVPLSVIDEHGQETHDDAEGDIALRVDLSETSNSFGVFDGYLGEDGTLDRKLRPASNGGLDQSWYLTGDRARRDKDGYFWFVGRNDDVINSAGYRIGPFEVESTLKQHPAVVESAVVSSPDPNRGEVVKAFVVLTQEASKGAGEALVKELQDFCKKNAAPYKYPRKIQFVDPSFLPKTISGKIQRKKLKEMEWDGGPKSKL